MTFHVIPLFLVIASEAWNLKVCACAMILDSSLRSATFRMTECQHYLVTLPDLAGHMEYSDDHPPRATRHRIPTSPHGPSPRGPQSPHLQPAVPDVLRRNWRTVHHPQRRTYSPTHHPPRALTPAIPFLDEARRSCRQSAPNTSRDSCPLCRIDQQDEQRFSGPVEVDETYGVVRYARRLTGLAGPEYHAIISFGLPFELGDCPYGKSWLGMS